MGGKTVRMKRRQKTSSNESDRNTERALLLRDMMEDGETHWLLTRLASIHYEEGNYERALELEKKALKRAPRCPLVLWDYAHTLDQMGRQLEAIGIWKKLLARGTDRIAYDECDEGIRWARSLLLDCRYRIALAYRSLGQTAPGLNVTSSLT